jgi:DNA polymerase sigma
VPLVRFTTTPRHGALRCDLLVAEHGGLEAAAWAASAVAAQPALAPLTRALKALVRQARLGDPSEGGIGGHALTNLALAYLTSTEHRGGGGAAHAHEHDLGAALAGVCRLFGHTFDFSRQAVSVAGVVPLRDALRDGWPARRAGGPGVGEGGAPPLRLHIQDPIRLQADVGAPTWNMGAVRQLLGAAADALDGGPTLATRSHARARAAMPLLCRVLDLDARGLPLELDARGDAAAHLQPRAPRTATPLQHSDRQYASRAARQ